MANCKECLNYYICGDIWNDKAERCKPFRGRNHIVELLCNVGDTVWLLDGKFAFKSKVDEIRILSESRILYHCENAYDWFEKSDFGKTISLRPEDAELMIGGNY